MNVVMMTVVNFSNVLKNQTAGKFMTSCLTININNRIFLVGLVTPTQHFVFYCSCHATYKFIISFANSK